MKTEQRRQEPADSSCLNGWICPIHFNTVWSEPGECPQCGTEMESGHLPLKAEKSKPDLVRRRLVGYCVTVMSALLGWTSIGRKAFAHNSGGMMGGMGMMHGGCPMCGQAWRRVPPELPKPKSQGYIKNLKDTLSLERLSLVQYQADEKKYQVHMPYMMVTPQEDLHIRWISDLFTAYGLSSAGPTPAVRKSETIDQAYKIAIELEEDLVPRYEDLINTAEDPESAQILNNILYQTNMHAMMFSHALRMGGGGMMGPGMMRHRRR